MCPTLATVSRDAPLPILLLPGLDGTGTLFAAFAAELRPALTPIVVSYPPDEVLGYADLVSVVDRRLPEGRFAVVAESFSGPLAIEIAARHAPRVVAVVLVASFVRAPLAFPRFLSFFLRPALFAVGPPGFAIRFLLAGGDAPDELVEAFEAALAHVQPEVLAARARATLAVDVAQTARSLSLPVLYLAGRQDRLVRVDAFTSLRACCPTAEFAAVDSPHLVLQRRPTEAAKIVQDFIERASSRE